MKIELARWCVPLGQGVHRQISIPPRSRLKKQCHSNLTCWTSEFNWGCYRNLCRGLLEGACATHRGFTMEQLHTSSQQLLATYVPLGRAGPCEPHRKPYDLPPPSVTCLSRPSLGGSCAGHHNCSVISPLEFLRQLFLTFFLPLPLLPRSVSWTWEGVI